MCSGGSTRSFGRVQEPGGPQDEVARADEAWRDEISRAFPSLVASVPSRASPQARAAMHPLRATLLVFSTHHHLSINLSNYSAFRQIGTIEKNETRGKE